MGEVYRARDTRLSRNVAIKVLPAEFAHDARLRARFEREAKTISALNHPHICSLHDVGRENGLDYLVMEYCEGTTLANRLERGALPIDQVLQTDIDPATGYDLWLVALRGDRAPRPLLTWYDVTKDGFVTTYLPPLSRPQRINVILNWTGELR